MSKEDVLLFTCYGKRGSGKSYMEHLKAKDKEIERLNNIIEEAINYTTKQMKKYEGYDRDFEIVLSNIVVMLGSDKE